MKSLHSLVFALTLALTSTQVSHADVQFNGSLKRVHHGNFEGTTDWIALSQKPGFVAVGPLEELKGEFTALDGMIISTVVHDKKLVNSRDKNQTSFLVWAHVKEWTKQKPLNLTDAVDLHELDEMIKTVAKANGIDVNKPFPFVIEGIAESATYHVLAPVKSKHSVSNHKQSATFIDKSNQQLTMVGFFSQSHHGVFTHKGSNSHIHVIDEDVTGHLDAIKLRGEYLVRFAKSYY